LIPLDLKLKMLDSFTSTREYHMGFHGVKLTDGAAYVSENGYTWFITDAIAAIKCEPELGREFMLVIRLVPIPRSEKAKMAIDDGDNNILYEQTYEWTTAERSLTLFYKDNVLMLPSEC
jgi:hypothetical protein